MAIRTRPRSAVAGGVSRWVTAEEAQEIAEQFGALTTVGELKEWLRAPLAKSFGTATAILGYRARLGAIGDSFSPGRLAHGLIVDVAASRRAEAIRSYARDRGLQDVVLALMSRSEQRCATCDRPLDPLSVSEFYCDEHRADEAAEVAALCALEAIPKAPGAWAAPPRTLPGRRFR